jgi:AraC-like DNA-binding protein
MVNENWEEIFLFFQYGSKFITEDIEYMCKLMFELLKAPIYFLDNNNDIFISFSHESLNNPVHPNKKELLVQLFENSNSYNFPIVKATKYLENYFTVNLIMDSIFIGKFIVGPVVYSNISVDTIDALIQDNQLPIRYKPDLVKYFNHIPIVEHTKFLSTSLLLYYSIYNVKLTLAEVREKNSSISGDTVKIKIDAENAISKNRQNTLFHHSLNHERNMYGNIKAGNKERLLQYLQKPVDGEFGILSKNNHLRSEKNLFICNVTLATRAAIEGGIHSELAFTLSDSYIQRVEEMQNIQDISSLGMKMLCDFADRVHEVKKLNHSRSIIFCKNYIFKHLYENIQLKELAKAVNLNPNYLSDLFKKQVGVSLSEYIQREKIEESKKLLVSSDYSIMEIAALLNFHDQSHFTRLFKKITGTTPKKYKDNHEIPLVK